MCATHVFNSIVLHGAHKVLGQDLPAAMFLLWMLFKVTRSVSMLEIRKHYKVLWISIVTWFSFRSLLDSVLQNANWSSILLLKIFLRLGISVFFFWFNEKKNKKKNTKFQESLLCVYNVDIVYKAKNETIRMKRTTNQHNVMWWDGGVQTKQTDIQTILVPVNKYWMDGKWQWENRIPNTVHQTVVNYNIATIQHENQSNRCWMPFGRKNNHSLFIYFFNFIFRLLLHQRLLLPRWLRGVLCVVCSVLFLLHGSSFSVTIFDSVILFTIS